MSDRPGEKVPCDFCWRDADTGAIVRCPSCVTGRSWRPGDKALVLFSDGVRRAAELSPGFVWATADGAHRLFAEDGFDAEPLLSLPSVQEGTDG
jgi:hypothetical protein